MPGLTICHTELLTDRVAAVYLISGQFDIMERISGVTGQPAHSNKPVTVSLSLSAITVMSLMMIGAADRHRCGTITMSVVLPADTRSTFRLYAPAPTKHALC